MIELLVAIAIGVVLAFGAMNLFLFSKLSYLQDEEMARLQENGRYALRYLSHELAMAGYLGTLLPGQTSAADAAGSACFNHLMDTAVPLEHIDNVTAGGEPAGAGTGLPGDCLVAGKHIAGSDMVLSRRTQDTPVMYGGERHGVIEAQAIYLGISSRGTEAGVSSRLERGGDSPGAAVELWEYAPQLLFLRDYSLAVGDGIPALCRKRLARSSDRMAPTQCLVEGIENLQLEFGIDADGDLRADRYTAAPTPVQLQSAVAARIYLLVRSVNPIAGYIDKRSYALGDRVIAAANDSFYRRALQTTVMLRNAGGPNW